ncbi:MAG: glycosyltransferase family 9 protein [Phycisphaerales bacterium]|nr:glycosyltransferase family 9 protein [Phycisphaerales bacterium]
MLNRPRKVLVVCPSWLGDVVMATPALRTLRGGLPGAFLGGLVRPGIDELLAGTDFFDELHIERAAGVMGPKLVASRIRPRRYDVAILFTNSFSTALITRLAFIPRRIGYDRDGRGVLLTDRVKAERRPPPHRGYKCVPAIDYYLRLAREIVPNAAHPPRLELAVTSEQQTRADAIIAAAQVAPGERFAILNPGANDPAKRWPADRFAALAAWLSRERGLPVLVNGGPAERELAEAVAADARSPRVVALPALGITIGALKGLVRRAAIMVTNDTGPRHLAAAFDIPTVTLFGPTDPRWTTLPHTSDGQVRRIDLLAEPHLPPGELADDHPDRCRIDRITLDAVREACAGLI